MLSILLASAALAEAPPTYEERLVQVHEARDELASEYEEAACDEERDEVVARARGVLSAAIVDTVLPSWFGTAWHMSGHTQRPGRGSIACGYLVSTVLRDVGLGVERARLAQQPAEYIVRTLVPEEHIWRFTDRPVSEVLDRVSAEGPGLYLVGLDTHVALLVHDEEGGTEICHATRTPPAWVRCEEADRSWAFVHSGYHVLGHALEDGVVEAWLTQSELPTVAWSPPSDWVWDPDAVHTETARD